MSDDSAVTNAPKQRVVGRPIQPGQVLNPNGRPKGSRHKLGEQFVAALQADFEENGPATITKVREERPHEYLKVVASILPKEVKVTTTQVEELSDDELAAGIAALQSILVAQTAREGTSPPAGGEPVKALSAIH